MLFRFASPYVLLLLLVLVPLAYWGLRAGEGGRARLQFSSLALASRVRPSLRQLMTPALEVLRVLTLALLVISLARPTVSRAAESTPGEGIDIVLALDVSFSMSEKDLGPKSRLETAKDVIREFVLARRHDHIGLVVFGSEAVVASPLTVDYPVLLQLLDDAGHGRLPEGTAIGNGLATSLNALRDARGQSRVVVLLTDGQNNSGDVNPTTAAQMAEIMKVRVYTVGVGAVAPSRRGPATIGSGIDEDLLRRMSETTGASYFRATDRATLKGIYDLIGRLEKTKSGQERFVEVADLSASVLLAAAGLLALEVLLRNTWFRRIP